MEGTMKIMNIEMWKQGTVTLAFEISQIKSFQKLSTGGGGERTIFVSKDLV